MPYIDGEIPIAGDIVIVVNNRTKYSSRPWFVIGQTLTVLSVNGAGNVNLMFGDCFWVASRFRLVRRAVVKPKTNLRVVRD
jgi:hypothetical protein